MVYIGQEERLSNFMKQIKNPFFYKCNCIIVKSVCKDEGNNLEEKLVGLFMAKEELEIWQPRRE